KTSYPAFSLYQYLYEKGELGYPFNLFMADCKPEIELYDLQSDPYELKNLVQTDTFQTIGKELLQRLQDEIALLEKDMAIEPPEIIEKGVKSGRSYGQSLLEKIGLPRDASASDMVMYWEKQLLKK